jgi:hypothetical protein
MRRKMIPWLAGGLVVLALLIQLIPLPARGHNPAVVAEPNWDSPQTRDLAKRACFDCHSNETVWPWYSYVAPVSWLVYADTMGGRSHLNFSEWNRTQRAAGEAASSLQDGEMPPAVYLPMHPSARLTAAEKQALIQGLRLSLH